MLIFNVINLLFANNNARKVWHHTFPYQTLTCYDTGIHQRSIYICTKAQNKHKARIHKRACDSFKFEFEKSLTNCHEAQPTAQRQLV